MKKNCLLVLGLQFFFMAPTFGSRIPQIYFKYSPGFDSVVCKNPGLIKPGEAVELTALLPKLQYAWNLRQAEFFETTIKIVRKDFKRADETATLFLCRDFPAMATPLLIWGYPFLKTARGNQALDPLFIGPIVFHETMHLYVDDILAGAKVNTPMLEKYKGEPHLVRVHLHVFAIEQMVYLKMDPTGQLFSTARKMDESYGPDYVRAWAIVSAEGAQAFISELHVL